MPENTLASFTITTASLKFFTSFNPKTIVYKWNISCTILKWFLMTDVLENNRWKERSMKYASAWHSVIDLTHWGLITPVYQSEVGHHSLRQWLLGLLGPKPDATLIDDHLHHPGYFEYDLVKFVSKCRTFYSRKCVRKCRLQIVRYFVQTSMCDALYFIGIILNNRLILIFLRYHKMFCAYVDIACQEKMKW